tara:strand:+ start:239 stop:421 length:183 start_codon:yes stop_codon:yes gene_type:complete
MIISDLNDCNSALNKIQLWLKKGVFNQNSYSEIEGVIKAVETYMGIPLPAKSFIESNCTE